MQNADTVVLWILSLIVAALAGSFLKSYLGKKGENLARKEDIDKLTAEVAAVTKTTKEIEATISGELWDKQRRWEMRRDMIFGAMKLISRVHLEWMVLSRWNTIYEKFKNDKEATDFMFTEHLKWLDLHRAYDESVALVELACGLEAGHELHELSIFLKDLPRNQHEDRDAYQRALVEFPEKVLAATRRLRDELNAKIT